MLFPNYERIVQRDLENWFKCIDIFEYHKEIPEMFCIMVRLGYGEIVCDQVKAEYQSFKDSKEYLSFDDLWIPDYAEFYREFADYCLFALGDAKLARRFYHLTNIDWYGFLTEDVFDRRHQISKEKRMRIEQNNDLISELDHYYDLLPMCKSGKYKKISDAYNSYLRERNSKYTYSEKVLDLLLDFVKSREKCWNSCSFSIKRILLIISHCLREDEEILKAVNSHMKTSIHIREILSHLKVSIQKWEKPLVDDLPMWEMYGDKASGCCVVLDPKTFWNSQESDTIDSLYQICYIYNDEGELRIAENHDSRNSASKVDTDSEDIRKEYGF